MAQVATAAPHRSDSVSYLSGFCRADRATGSRGKSGGFLAVLPGEVSPAPGMRHNIRLISKVAAHGNPMTLTRRQLLERALPRSLRRLAVESFPEGVSKLFARVRLAEHPNLAHGFARREWHIAVC